MLITPPDDPRRRVPEPLPMQPLPMQALPMEPLPPVVSTGVRTLSGQVQSPESQYGLLVVSETQLDSLLGRPGLRRLNPRLLLDGRRGRSRMAWLVAAAAALVVLGGLIGSWLSSPGSLLSSVLPGRVMTWARPPVAPPLLTGAGFSLAVAAPRSADAAAALVGRLQDVGLPGFAGDAAGASYQVFVGPYASLDEAESVQRRLVRGGFPASRLAVDDNLRHVPVAERSGAIPGETGVVLVGAPGRMSLVFELAMTPRQVIAQQTSDTHLEVEIAPVRPGVLAREWSAPYGVHLVEHVSIEEGDRVEGEASLRALLTIPRAAHASARVEGRRVYVDLTWPEPARPAPRARPAAARTAQADPAPPRPPSRSSAAPAIDSEPFRNALTRFAEITPFLLSSAASPSPDVLVALDGTLASLAETLQAMRVPRDTTTRHGQLVAAVAAARRAVDPHATGDRLAYAHQAVGLFEAAKGH